MEPIQAELHRVARHWNTHKIRPYPDQETPHGKPDVLFFLPQLKGTDENDLSRIDPRCSVLSENATRPESDLA